MSQLMDVHTARAAVSRRAHRLTPWSRYTPVAARPLSSYALAGLVVVYADVDSVR